MPSSRAAQTIVLIAIILCIDAEPSCRESGDKQEVTCATDNRDYVLSKGLISDNLRTTRIILQECRIIDINLDAFNNLPNLRHLDLSRNDLRTLTPGVFNGANKVTHLVLSYNQITEIPLRFFEDIRYLELLDLKGNKISSLEQGLFDPLTRIGHLDLSSNMFVGQQLSNQLFTNNPYVGFLDFSGIVMTDTTVDLLQSFKMIDFLNLAGCALTEVPKFATATNLRSMKRLYLNYNNIRSLNDPNTFVYLVNIEKLNLADNKIDTIHGNIFMSQNRLKSVTLKNNRLKSLPETLFTGKSQITEVDLSQNLIECIHTDTFKGTSLDKLDLSGNKFSFLPADFGSFLTSAGASLSKFTFNNSPWQCACLKELLGELKHLNVEYNSEEFSGTKPVCVMVKSSFRCDRDITHNKLYIKEYMNIINGS